MADRDFLRRLPDAEAAFERRQALLWKLHVDLPLLSLVLLICGYGLVVLYSAVDQSVDRLTSQAVRLGAAFGLMLLVAQVPPATLRRWAVVFYAAGIALLVGVMLFGVSAKGAQRWIDLPGLPRFQPSEMMKIAVPIMIAAHFEGRSLPPRLGSVVGALALIALPAVLIAAQPDLGTAVLVAGSGLAVVLLAGVRWSWVFAAVAAAVAALPALWAVMKDYQRQRVLTLINPESDPLGAGWNIIQSKTAIGSGGLFGKGLFSGTQSHLDFLPESHTDFIIAVLAEEFGFVGVMILLLLYFLLLTRGLYIATQGRDAFARLLAGGLTITFFTYLFVNIAMVSGLLPVVGVPLPLVSYGGTSALTLMAGFGILMAIRTDHKLLRA
jgi:rod shape determining protein RodA